MYNYYEKELQALYKTQRLRSRDIINEDMVDFASNDYLGLAEDKKALKKTYKKLKRYKTHSPKASLLVNGYHPIHKKFEQKLCKLNNFEDGIVIGSGFLANIALIESLVRKKDLLFIDENYHASGVLATKLLPKEQVIFFKHNDPDDLFYKISTFGTDARILIAIEGVYSMDGDIAPKEIYHIANRFHALLIVDEAHSSGVIGENLLGWFDHFHLPIAKNHIKMGTLGKAYGSYGAYILASRHIIQFLENRAKSIIYTTAPSLFDIALAHENLKTIQKRKKKIKQKIDTMDQIVYEQLGVSSPSLIVPITINNNEKVMKIKQQLLEDGFLVGAIRQPTVKKAIIRIILRTNNTNEQLQTICQKIKEYVHL
jgi:8-amino-7-oxononanoate synthase